MSEFRILQRVSFVSLALALPSGALVQEVLEIPFLVYDNVSYSIDTPSNQAEASQVMKSESMK